MAKRKKKKRSRRLLLWMIVVLIGIGCYYYRDVWPLEDLVERVAAESVEGTDGMAECLPVGEGDVVRHSRYVLGYSEEHEQAVWVYYSPSLGRGSGKASRTDDFRRDPDVTTGSAEPSDYVKSGYDRGHLCPAGDMTSSVKEMSETFYMSNMSPQVPGFNRGIWKRLEEQVRTWAKRETVWIATGPVFKDLKGTIGRNEVTVPGYYYKVVYSPSREEMIAFVLPNASSKKDIASFVVSVDSVEAATGLDLFSQLPDNLEDSLEAASDINRWE